ncbi:uncharacterized protein LOC117869664 isoform X2 [Trachemys scripta elegans]|uniref:uncharacterized protein LOC117869664 isoform X2 n=1 Tax=Trachemys scripta elegans TaxID=31138 RepID=UPI0015561100|nr:uncharacterized protein LOC117869664 isoform X2 [Trachemys scripta elegans]
MPPQGWTPEQNLSPHQPPPTVPRCGGDGEAEGHLLQRHLLPGAEGHGQGWVRAGVAATGKEGGEGKDPGGGSKEKWLGKGEERGGIGWWGLERQGEGADGGPGSDLLSPPVPYQVAVPETVARIQPELAQLKPGYQKDAQVYKCASCSRVACQLPLDCPVEDVWKNEGERTVLTCRVQFQTPPDVRHNWKFVKDLRTRDLSLFRDLHPGASSSIVLRPTRGSHRGTYACQLAQEDDVLARNYFYLNGASVAGPWAGPDAPGLGPGLASASAPQTGTINFLIRINPNSNLRRKSLSRPQNGGHSWWTSPAMREEVETGARFLSRLVNRHGRLDEGRMEQFGERLAVILRERYSRHWYPENPAKGQAYRCIRINRRQQVDESLLRACAGCGLEYSELALPRELSLWIDPGEVCCRLGENSQYFTVSPSERGGGKGTPEPETSDYHSESPSESSSEDEGSVRPSPAPAPAPSRPTLREPSKQAAELFYVPAPMWVPCTAQRLVSYIPTYQPLTFYYVSVGAAKRSNPDRLRRLTHRAAKA